MIFSASTLQRIARFYWRWLFAPVSLAIIAFSVTGLLLGWRP